MTPSAVDLGIIAGDNVRLIPEALPPGTKSQREVFFVEEAPAPGVIGNGQFGLTGKLSKERLYISPDADVISEKLRE